MNIKLVFKITSGLLVIASLFLLPVIPVSIALKEELPEISVSPEISNEDAVAIIIEARGGNFVSVNEVLAGVVNQPFTYINIINPENVPYPGSIESKADVVIGHGWQVDSMSGGGYKVLLKKSDSGWVVIQRSEYLI
jgi:hypothetical protein